MSTPGQKERPDTIEERYRLYVDESGNHVYKCLDEIGHRYLCLLGCWFRGDDYREFHKYLEDFKQRHLPHNPDHPLILHREDVINRRSAFGVLCDARKAQSFDSELLRLIEISQFKVVAIVIDKLKLTDLYGAAPHPYHLAMGFLLQRYCGYLNHINRCGDVLAESRGGREDRLLKDSYTRVYERGIWITDSAFFQEALTSKQLKVKPKRDNIAGLQLADILGHPIRQMILLESNQIKGKLGPFAGKLSERIRDKFNKHLYTGRIWGY